MTPLNKARRVDGTQILKMLKERPNKSCLVVRIVKGKAPIPWIFIYKDDSVTALTIDTLEKFRFTLEYMEKRTVRLEPDMSIERDVEYIYITSLREYSEDKTSVLEAVKKAKEYLDEHNAWDFFPAFFEALKKTKSSPPKDHDNQDHAECLIQPKENYWDILSEAVNIAQERGDSYGDVSENFERWIEIYRLISPEGSITPSKKELALLMVALKLSREANKPKQDNRIDAINYMAIYNNFNS